MAKRKSSVGTAAKKTRKIGGKKFTRVGCSKTKGGRNKLAKSLRAKGYTARVIGNCVFKGPKSKRKTA